MGHATASAARRVRATFARQPQWPRLHAKPPSPAARSRSTCCSCHQDTPRLHRPPPPGYLSAPAVCNTRADHMELERARDLHRRERVRIAQALARLSVPGRDELAGRDEMADAASQLYEEEIRRGTGRRPVFGRMVRRGTATTLLVTTRLTCSTRMGTTLRPCTATSETSATV